MTDKTELDKLDKLDAILEAIVVEDDTPEKLVLEYVKTGALVSIARSLIVHPPIVAPVAAPAAAPVGTLDAAIARAKLAHPQRVGAAVGFGVGDKVFRHPFGVGVILRLAVDQGEDVAVVEYESNGAVQHEWVKLLKHADAPASASPEPAAAPGDYDVSDDDIDVEVPLGGAASSNDFPDDFDDDEALP